jgi:hypothetical protein
MLATCRGAQPFTDQFGNTYLCIRHTAEILGLDSSAVSRVLKGKMSQTKGYRFKYKATP